MSIGLESEQEVWAQDELAVNAEQAMRKWLPDVRCISQWAHSGRRRDALTSLVQWYESVCALEVYVDAAPLDGLDALVDELTGAPPYEALRRLGLARWALLVSEKLVQWRADLVTNAAPAEAKISRDHLELAFTTALRHFNADALNRPKGLSHELPLQRR